MEFEWDEAKAKRNVEKHGIDFEDVIEIFEHPVLEYRSQREGEERRLAIGMMKQKEVTVVYVRRDTRYRLISARRSTRNERQAYQKALAR